MGRCYWKGRWKLEGKTLQSPVQQSFPSCQVTTCVQFKNVNSAVKFICKIRGSGAGCIGQVKSELLPPNHLSAAVNEMPWPTEDHRLCLVKYVANTYLNLRLSSYSKIYSKAVINFGKPSSRHHLTKTILFLNQ
jgi:hypothetical protein